MRVLPKINNRVYAFNLRYLTFLETGNGDQESGWCTCGEDLCLSCGQQHNDSALHYYYCGPCGNSGGNPKWCC